MRGTIVRLVMDRGFGFIRCEDGVERFFHRSEVQMSGRRFDELRVGQTVTLTPNDGQKGPRATEVLATV